MNESFVLTAEQRKQFVTEGYLLLKGAFSKEQSEAWVYEECLAKGYDLNDQSTWTKPYDRIETIKKENLATFSPQGWAASAALMGGQDRVRSAPNVGLFALNLAQGADRPFEPATPSSPGWHKDGWHFIHFLDSYEQGLLGIPLLTDVLPSGGATFIAAGSVGPVARFLAKHPEGVMPTDFPVKELLSEPGITFLEATGEAGDFYLLHPYLLHAVSQNILRRPRAISNLLYELNEPMKFDRADGNYSPVEEAILHGLGVDRFEFAITDTRYKGSGAGPMDPSIRDSRKKPA